MHCEHLVEAVWRQHIVQRLHQLQAHKRGFNATQHKENQTRADIHHAQFFMIN